VTLADTHLPAARIVDGVRTYHTDGVEVRALDRVSLEFPRHRFTTVIGPSGSGKSTLLHCLAGLDRLTSGHVYLGGLELGTLGRTTRTRVRRQKVGVVFQGFNLHPGFDVAQNIALPSIIAGRKPDLEWVDGIVSRLRLGHLLRRRPIELSGGEQQRVAAARALAGRPELILADEPTGNLDSRAAGELLAILRLAVDDLEQTVILVTHNVAAASAADYLVVLVDGRVMEVAEAPTVDDVNRLARLSTG
jgi:putative ABC transport system ATP-binding protein